MGAMGRYIDGLSEVERDRLITARGLARVELRPNKFGEACLVGTAQPTIEEDGRGGWPVGREAHEAADAFDCSTRTRFPLARVVRAIKQRAAKGNRVTLPEPRSVSPETVEV